MAELAALSEQDLAGLRNLGAGSITEIREKLAEIGEALRQQAPPSEPVKVKPATPVKAARPEKVKAKTPGGHAAAGTLGHAADAYLADNGPLATESTKRTYGAALSQCASGSATTPRSRDLTPEKVASWLQEASREPARRRARST